MFLIERELLFRTLSRRSFHPRLWAISSFHSFIRLFIWSSLTFNPTAHLSRPSVPCIKQDSQHLFLPPIVSFGTAIRQSYVRIWRQRIPSNGHHSFICTWDSHSATATAANGSLVGVVNIVGTVILRRRLPAAAAAGGGKGEREQ